MWNVMHQQNPLALSWTINQVRAYYLQELEGRKSGEGSIPTRLRIDSSDVTVQMALNKAGNQYQSEMTAH